MIRNGKDIANGTQLSTQVCIIGSGQAGITTAWYLQKAGIDVILIEGSRDFQNNLEASWPDKELLYNGEAVGQFTTNEPDFLIRPYVGGSQTPWERERIYGGTSSHWGGQCRPLDPITFEARPNFPGWPIDRKDLDPFYAEAAKFCVLHSDDFGTEYWAEVLEAEIPDLQSFNTEMYQVMGSAFLNFATRRFDGTTIGETDVDVILNASLLEIDHQQGSVCRLQVASMDEQTPPQKATEFTIEADSYVLACGAVANARQLLLSNVGNDSDQVGRYFMGHPITPSFNAITVRRSFLNGSETRLLNGQTPTGQFRDSNGVTVTGRFIANAEATTDLGIGRCWFRPASSGYYFELAPNPESRITLSTDVDPVFQQRQTKINWKLSSLDERTYEESNALFKRAVDQLGGEVEFATWEEVKPRFVFNGHHIGTTRMSDDPALGVVDANLKVHSLDNFYVAGSSVYPCAGISNPTFTIVALSIRLAAHLTAKG